jgi:pyruvate dehydrogenase E2 component (dihydrolipoamide acetyltransferase)
MMEAPGAKGAVRVQQPTSAERSAVRRVAEARATIPHIELSVDADATAALEIAERERGPLTVPLLAACATALREVPRANGAYRDGRYELYSRVNIGVLLTGEELFAIPTVFDVDQKSRSELHRELEELVAGAREHRLSPPAFSAATFTLWDAGEQGIERPSIVINPPQAAALAAGAVRHGTISLTLAADHRILHAGLAARFLNRIRSAFERPRDQ